MSVICSIVDPAGGGFDVYSDGRMASRPRANRVFASGSLRLVDAAGELVVDVPVRVGEEGSVVFSALLTSGGALDLYSSGVVRVRQAAA